MIKYTSSKQISIEDFIQPFGGTLSKENRWVKLAYLLPWDDVVSVYIKSMSQKKGRKAVDPRVAVGTLIIRHILRGIRSVSYTFKRSKFLLKLVDNPIQLNKGEKP